MVQSLDTLDVQLSKLKRYEGVAEATRATIDFRYWKGLENELSKLNADQAGSLRQHVLYLSFLRRYSEATAVVQVINLEKGLEGMDPETYCITPAWRSRFISLPCIVSSWTIRDSDTLLAIPRGRYMMCVRYGAAL